MTQTVEVCEKQQTLAELLARGVELLADRQRDADRREQAEREKLQELWNLLRQQAKEDLHALGNLLPSEPPDDFAASLRTLVYKVVVAPFGGVAISASFALHYGDSDSPAWVMQDRGRWNAFCVGTRPMLSWNNDCDPPHWYVRTNSSHDTADLAEAVAVCHRESQAWKRLENEAKTKSPPPHIQKRLERKALVLTDAEESLILAFRQLAGERE